MKLSNCNELSAKRPSASGLARGLPNIPAVVVTEESQDLLEGFVFGLRHLFIREYPEYG